MTGIGKRRGVDPRPDESDGGRNPHSERDAPTGSAVKALALPAGPLLAVATGFGFLAGGATPEVAVTLAVVALTVTWWIFEPIPIPATSLLPLALLPMFGVLSMEQVSRAYGHPLILLLLGGFLLSAAMESSGAHRRIALNMVRAFGGASPRRLVFGFMATSALLSMWISNTATALMLLPVALAVTRRCDDEALVQRLLLGIAYAASIGGMGTPIGTPPNVVFMGVYQEATGIEISFVEWMSWAIPVVLVFLPVAGFRLTRGLASSARIELPPVGEWTPAERRVLIIFALTALAWVTRKTPGGGWTELFGVPWTHDAMVALIAAAAMFITGDGRGGRLLDWHRAARVPWGMLILFGAGLAIASAFKASGLSAEIGGALTALSAWPVLALLLAVCLAVTFLTELTSNTATTTLLMPILAAAALGAMIDPKLLMVPAALSASCAFMLPVATVPNVIVFSTEQVPMERMAREGLGLNFLGALIIATICFVFFGGLAG